LNELIQTENFSTLLGLEPDPEDNRDFKIRFTNKGPILKVENNDVMLPIRDASIHDGYDLRPMMPVIRDQGSTPQCAAYAIEALLSYFCRIDFGEFLHFQESWLYDESRKLEKIRHDRGTYFRAILKLINKFGALPAKEWNQLLRGPKKEGEKLKEILENYKIQSYASVSLYEDYIKKAIRTFGPVLCGMHVYGYWRNVKKNGLVRMPEDRDERLGGHGMSIVGWMNNPSSFIVRNSWGDYGDNGYCYIPFQYVREQGFSCWSVVDTRGSKDLYDPSEWEKFRDSKLPKALKKAFGIPF
jgi:C1A family cysteine protease